MWDLIVSVPDHCLSFYFTSGLGLDAVSLAWPTVVQQVVSFNSGLQWGLSKSTLSLFRHSDRFDFVFSLRCTELESHYANRPSRDTVSKLHQIIPEK